MINFDDYKEVIKARETSMNVDEDRREIMRECNTFVTKKNGQWEPTIWEMFGTFKRPRYTFDLCRPVIDSIYGELTQNDFNITVKPMGYGASKETAKTFAGLIKNSENISNASDVYNQVARKQITTGFAAFRLEQDWCSGDSFDQDLFFRPIHDAIDRIWFLGNYQLRTAADADGVTIDHLISVEEYKERFGEDKSPQSLGDNNQQHVYYYKRTGIRISELIYKVKVTKTLYQFPDGMVLSEDEALSSGTDLSKCKKRVRESDKIMIRFYDGARFLNEPEDTVFEDLPVIPVLPNFEIVEDKPISIGAVEWLMDWQRVRNYAGSKNVEDVALLPRQKVWMTKKQGAGNETQNKTLNVNNSATAYYTHDPEAMTPPFVPAQVMANPATTELLANTEMGINSTSGVHQAALGNNPALQSGVAIDKIQNKGDIGKIEYFNAMQAALSHAGRVAVAALKNLLDTQQERRVINEDGSYEMITLNETDLNGNKINDLSKGVYDVVCDIGPAFRNRQEKSVEQIIALGQYDPTLIPQGKDVLLNNIDSPGMEILAERARATLLKSGDIPESQWTEEEKQAAAAADQAAAQNPPPVDPNMIAAQAMLESAHAKSAEQQINAIKLQQSQQKLDFDQEKEKTQMLMDMHKNSLDEQVKVNQMLNVMADTLQKISSSMGADAVISPDAAQAFQEQAKNIEQVQQQI